MGIGMSAMKSLRHAAWWDRYLHVDPNNESVIPLKMVADCDYLQEASVISTVSTLAPFSRILRYGPPTFYQPYGDTKKQMNRSIHSTNCETRNRARTDASSDPPQDAQPVVNPPQPPPGLGMNPAPTRSGLQSLGDRFGAGSGLGQINYQLASNNIELKLPG